MKNHSGRGGAAGGDELPPPIPGGFTLVEVLLVVAIIGILSSLIISAVIGAAADSRETIARQQQVVVQEALNAWIMSNSTGTNTLATAKARYANRGTPLNMITNASYLRGYLNPLTLSNLSTNTGGYVRNLPMVQAKYYLTFSEWTTDPPFVELQTGP